MPKLTHQRVREVLHYDRETGEFTWLVSTGTRGHVGDLAGCFIAAKDNRRRAVIQIGIDGERFWRAHLAWFWITGRWPHPEIDHRDGDPINDRWGNLREATRSQNEANKSAYRNNVSGLKGAHYHKSGYWRAAIRRNGHREYLGTFATAEAAHVAYMVAAARIDGDFARAA